jgi:hypothetical protein
MNNNNQILFLSKIYAWSIIFEPLLFFILARSFIGFNLSIAKVFELLLIFFVLLSAIFPLNTSKSFKLRLPDFNSLIYGFIYLYMISLIISFIIGGLSGGYQLDLSFYQSSDYNQHELNIKILSDAFTSFFIIGFYFVFFTFLTSTFLETREKLEYFFVNFRRVFLFSLFVGYLDYFISFTGYDLVSRHAFENLFVGSRFHGYAGEPRHAAVYLLFGLAIFHLESLLFNRPIKKYIFYLVVLALILTQSITLFVALFIFALLILPLYIYRLEIKKILIIFLTSLAFVSVGIFAGYNIDAVSEFLPRVDSLVGYFEAFDDVWFILESKAVLPYFIRIQLGEVYPLYDMISMVRNGEILPVLFGSGLGSAALNNYSYVDTIDAYGNPNSYGVRLIYEAGIIGSLIYLLAFFVPVRILASSFRYTEKMKLYTYMALVVAVCLAIRSSLIYIYLGVVISTLTLMMREKSIKEKEEWVQ